MVDITAIAAAMTSLNVAKDILKTFKDVSETTAVQGKVFEFVIASDPFVKVIL